MTARPTAPKAAPPDAAEKVAVVLFNLGGPDRPEAIRPFLVNLFSDPAILRVPRLVRPLLARIIAGARLKPATANYALLGGSSPLLQQTERQAALLRAALPELEARCFVAMRYWHPFSEAAARAVRDWNPDRVLLLPLYPQFSTTTTGSSLSAWREAAARVGLAKPTAAVCCYHSDAAFAAATAAILRRSLLAARAASGQVPVRVLFSAHGLPEVIVRAGDPYQYQVERTVSAVLAKLGEAGLDWQICYQSPRHAAAVDRPVYGPRRGAGGARWRGRAGDADRLRLGTFRDAGRARRRVPRTGRAGRRARLFPCAHPER